MKAVYINRFGGPEVLEYGDLAAPECSDGELLIDIVAASVNRADHHVRAGHSGNVTFPQILGRDFSGVVSANSVQLGGFRRGDRVFGVCEAGHEGAYAEQIAIAATIVAPVPAELTHRDAAAVALVGLTAAAAIEDTLAVANGETVLVQGAAGGVGSMAIQFAKLRGAKVIATASTANLEYLRSLGADEVIDYRASDFTTIGPVCDAVFDAVGGDVAQHAFDVLRPGGRAAFIASGRTPPTPPRSDLSSLRPRVDRSRARLERIAALVVAGRLIRPAIVEFPLAETRRAHEAQSAGHAHGKIVLTTQKPPGR